MFYYKKIDENGNLTLIATTVELSDSTVEQILKDEFMQLENSTTKEDEHE